MIAESKSFPSPINNCETKPKKEYDHCEDKIINENLVNKDDSKCSGSKPFQCEICDFKTFYFKKLLWHNKTHHSLTTTFCNQHKIKLKWKMSLKKNKTIHLDKKQLKCECCDFKTFFQSNLKKHKENHTTLEPFQYSFYDYTAIQKRSQNKRKLLQSNKKVVNCKHCDFKTKYCSILQKHIKKIHKIEQINSCSSESTKKSINHKKIHFKKMFQCFHCDYITTSHKRLANHTNKLHFKIYSCELCSYITKIKCDLFRHALIHITELYHCPLCDYKASLETFSNYHSEVHIGYKTVKCTYCNFKCIDKIKLLFHIKTHSDEYPFPNNFKMIQKQMLLDSITNPKLQLYPCDSCDFKAKSESQLRIHIQLHKTELLQNNICNCKSQSESFLMEDTNISEHQPLKCNHCADIPLNNECLEIIPNNHIDIKYFFCNSCDYKTVIEKDFEFHLMFHSHFKNFECEFCDYKVLLRHKLTEHMKHHKNEKLYNNIINDFEAEHEIKFINFKNIFNQTKINKCKNKYCLYRHPKNQKCKTLPKISWPRFR